MTHNPETTYPSTLTGIIEVKRDGKTLVSFPLARVSMPILNTGDMVEIECGGHRVKGVLFEQNSEHILLWFPNVVAARLAIAALYPTGIPTAKDIRDYLANVEVAPTIEES